MRAVEPEWQVMVAVCGHQRRQRSSCGDRGSELWKALKDHLRRHDLADRVIAVRTSCLGVCAADGVTVGILKGDSSQSSPELWVVARDGKLTEQVEAIVERVMS